MAVYGPLYSYKSPNLLHVSRFRKIFDSDDITRIDRNALEDTLCPNNLIGSGSSSGKALDCRLDGPGSIPGVGGGGNFSSLLRFQTDPGVHSDLYKMRPGLSPGVKAAERKSSHPVSS